MKAKKLSIAKLSFDERQAIVDTIKEHDYLHKDIILERKRLSKYLYDLKISDNY